jgi:tRNA dimethylallyltransferase
MITNGLPAYNLLTILGPTASGKTTFAANAAFALQGEIISADSRQVYRGMNIGTGKDLCEYIVHGETIKTHLIDIVDAGYQYNVYEFQRDFVNAFNDISNRGLFPILCGGTGLYLETALQGYRMQEVPENLYLREKLSNKTLAELESILKTYKQLHNSTDIDTKKRAIRAIEIAEYYQNNSQNQKATYPSLHPLIVGLDICREERRRRITQRLLQRLREGLVDEVRQLLHKGISEESLIYYGLEYKYVTLYLTNVLTYEQMVAKLEIAIHQFAKRQMTWFRGMERRGITIHWIDATEPLEEKLNKLGLLFKQSTK